MYRTHTCGQLRAANVNETVTLAGWVQKVRNLGAMTFIDLRDRYGITQIVVEEHSPAEARETVCRVLGIVEDVRSGGVNRNGAGIGGGVRLFLTDVKLQGFKMIVGHNNSPSLIRYLVGYGRFW